ncbi:vacuolar protein sorting-associated protein 16B [Lucilia sericata]|uniref:vacuolar protein sorting-associated protein 16B n=1 Tax=Lucilia sericata TaxID=13632 RepID=UPI0018A865FA|nr:vacuolar protein sorting-associated protein 16B [Lucilia sericata]
MATNFDNDSYWNRSASKAFNFDDDDTDDTEFKTVAAGYELTTDFGGILNDDTISEASFDNSAAGGALNLSIKSLLSEEALKCILDEQSMDDRLIPKGLSAEEELKILRRQIQNTLYTPSPSTTAQKLLSGVMVNFEVFKSLHDKQQLLEAVLNMGAAGDAIISVVLFLERTLNRSDFLTLLSARPKALQHYLAFLKQQNPQEAVKLLKDLGKAQDSLLLLYKEIYQSDTVKERKEKLQQIMENYKASSLLYPQLLHANIKLLNLLETERTTLNNMIDIDSSPIEVLYACCAKYNNWKEQDMLKTISPYHFAADLQISPGQFEWCALNERTQAQAYADLPHIFEHIPTWHPMKQKQFHISFSLDLAILRLHELQAPATILYLFLSKVSNNNDKLTLARRVKCIKAEIDALMGLKDIGQLTLLRDSLAERSEEQFYCDNALKTAQTKRWTTDNIKLKLNNNLS